MMPMDLRTERLRVEVVPSDRFYDDFRQDPTPYTMRSKLRGAVLIINNKVFSADTLRNGAQVDQENLVELFRQMGGYDVTLRENLTAVVSTNKVCFSFVKYIYFMFFYFNLLLLDHWYVFL